VALAVSLLLAFALTDHGGTSIQLAPNRVGFIDAKSDRVTKSIPVGREPRALALGFGFVWVADYGDRTVTRVDPRTDSTVPIAVGGTPTGIAVADGAVWVWTLEGLLVPIDPRSAEPETAIRLRAQTENVGKRGGIAAGGGFLWVTAPPTTVIRVKPGGTPRHTPVEPDSGAAGPVAYQGGRVWVAASDGVYSIDAQTMYSDATITVGPVRGLALSGGDLWVASGGPGQVGGVVPALRFVDLRSRLPGGPVRGVADPVAVAAGADSIWAASASDRTVSRVDPSKNKVYTISVGETPTALVADADGVWVAVE
jgi:hypothetical protein